MCKPLKREIKAVQTAAYGRVCDQIHDVYSMLLHGVLKPVCEHIGFLPRDIKSQLEADWRRWLGYD